MIRNVTIAAFVAAALATATAWALTASGRGLAYYDGGKTICEVGYGCVTYARFTPSVINYEPGFSSRSYDSMRWWPKLLLESRDLVVVAIPLWIPLALFATPPAFALWSTRLRRLRIEAGRCPRCGYDLAGNTTGVCPECGNKIGSAA